jgi:CHASE3 domain sensor protein
MARSFTLTQQIAAAYVIPVLIMILLGGLSYQNTQTLVESGRWVEHTYQVLGELNAMVLSLKDAETGERGYVITGKEEFLGPYREAVTSIGKEYEDIRAITRDNPEQQRRLDALHPLIQNKLAELARIIEERRRGGLEAATLIIEEGRTRQSMNDIRAAIVEMAAAEQALLKKRAAENEAASRQLTRFLVGGNVAAVLIVVVSAALILKRLGRRIGTAVQHLRSSSAELEAAAGQQVKGAQGQASASTEVSTTIRELVSTSHQIAESAQRVTHMATETSAVAEEGDHTVRTAQKAMDSVKAQVDRVVLHMLALGKKSQEIGSILDIINELAEQTNILSINATIEAAGAGEAGRRFSVVADEIRKLADRVGRSTKDVRTLIDEVRAAANTTVMATEDGSKAVDASVQHFAEVTTSFKRITEYVAGTAQASREIELSTKQQTTAVEQVGMAINDVAQTAKETEASSKQTLQTASQMASLSQELVRLIRREEGA